MSMGADVFTKAQAIKRIGNNLQMAYLTHGEQLTGIVLSNHALQGLLHIQTCTVTCDSLGQV